MNKQCIKIGLQQVIPSKTKIIWGDILEDVVCKSPLKTLEKAPNVLVSKFSSSLVER